MDIIKRIKSFGIIIGVVSIALGIVLAFKPVQTETVLNTVVGAGLLVIGAVKLIQEIFIKKEVEKSWVYVLLPLLMMILGVYVLLNSTVTTFTIGIIISIFAFTMAFDRFATARIRHKNDMEIKSTVISGIIHLIFGILMCTNAFKLMTAITMMTGIYLMVNGLMILVSSLYFKDLQ